MLVLFVRKRVPRVSERLGMLHTQRIPQRVKAAVFFRSPTDALSHLMVRRRLCSLITVRPNLNTHIFRRITPFYNGGPRAGVI